MFNKKKTKTFICTLLLLLGIIPIIVMPILIFVYVGVIFGLIILLFFYILNFISLLGIYKNKRSDIQTKITWTFLEFAFPGFGAYLYFLVGRVPKKMLNDVFKKSTLLESDLLKLDVSDSNFELLENGIKKFTNLFDDLRNAKHFINIQYFIITPGVLYDKLFSILLKKKEEGVKIKILYDHVGNHNWPKKEIKKIIDWGIEVIEFRPIKWLKLNGTDNWRTHNKIVVIDGEIGYFGGVNIADEYVNLNPKYKEWLDIHFRVKGSIVESLNTIFCIQWFLATKVEIFKEFINFFEKTKFISSNTNFAKVLYDSPHKDVPIMFNELKHQISIAQKNVKIITPYISIPVSLKDTIRKAILKGIEIEIITIGKADKISAYYQSSFDIDTLTDLGVKVYKVNNTFIHSKLYIFDDKLSIVGTTNLDFRSFFHHYEINIILNGELVEKVIEYFKKIKLRTTLQTNRRSNWTIKRSLMYLIIRLFKGSF